MKPSPPARRTSWLLFVLIPVLLSTSCGPEIVVRLSTRVYGDGSVDRKLEARGYDPEGAVPEEVDWLTGAVGIDLVGPALWQRTEFGPGLLRAEGFFHSVEELFAPLGHVNGGGIRPDRTEARLDRQDLLVLKRWSYTELYGDPYGPADLDLALSQLVDWMTEALRQELQRQFGGDLDSSPAEAFLRTEARSLLFQLLLAIKQAPDGIWNEEPWKFVGGVLERHGVPAAPPDNQDFWEAQTALLLKWSRVRVVESLSRPDRPLEPEELSFWPTELESLMPDNFLEDEFPWLNCTGGDEWSARACKLWRAAMGYYGVPLGPGFRFEARVMLPGRLLRTNGTPHQGAAVWLFRGTDLGSGDVVMTAESVEIEEEPLIALAARRDFNPEQLLHLTDILANRDREGSLLQILQRAIDQGRLSLLRDPETVPNELRLLARELADLLDPDVEPPAPL